MTTPESTEQKLFQDTIRAFEAEIANVGAHLHFDSAARVTYAKEIQRISMELSSQAKSGAITWAEAAKQTNETRNAVMDIIRNRSTPVGMALAQRMKAEGKTLNELIARKTMQIHGKGVNFNNLSVSEQNRIYAEIVKSAGRSNPRVTATMQNAGRAGRGLIFLSVALSVYNVAVAENKTQAAVREVAITGAGIGGGIAGGALAGLACGPGAPVCVTVGAFIGGGLAAFGMSWIW